MSNSSPVKKDLKSYYAEFRASLSESQFKKFISLKSNKKKISFVANLEKSCSYPIRAENNHGKNIDEANALKNRGNVEFQKQNYDKACWFYSQAILKSSINMPGCENEAIIFYANRSASLYYLRKYELAISDINFALKNNYPRHLSYKILDRKARCFLALEKYEKASDTFKLTIQALDESKLLAEKRQKLQKDVQIMLLMLKKHENQENTLETKQVMKSKHNYNQPNSKYKAIKADIDIEFSPKMGRFAKAKNNIKVGDIVLIEESHCAVLLDAYKSTHCHHCFRRVSVLYPCPTCDQIIFCSEICAQRAVSTYHQIECSILRSLWEANISVICLMALRMITQHSLEFFFKEKNNSFTAEKNQEDEYGDSNYETVCNLVIHEEERKPEDILNRIHMALVLMKCLQKTSYFQKKSTFETGDEKEKIGLSDDELLIAQRLLHHLQILQFNAHEVSELIISNKSETSVSKFIGGALYPTLALFNHSCNPGVVRYFEGTKVITRAIRNISAGEMVAENYGPLYTTTQKTERQQLLRERYWFMCECEACNNEWPTVAEMNTSSIRLRCTNIKCRGSIIIDTQNEKFLIKCKLCSTNNNIMKPLKSLQETDQMFIRAKNWMKSSNTKKALKEFLGILNLLDQTLLLPSKDYHVCQEEIRACYLRMGNQAILNSG